LLADFVLDVSAESGTGLGSFGSMHIHGRWPARLSVIHLVVPCPILRHTVLFPAVPPFRPHITRCGSNGSIVGNFFGRPAVNCDILCHSRMRAGFVSTSQVVAQHLPYLRRYARALTGSQSSGDAYVVA